MSDEQKAHEIQTQYDLGQGIWRRPSLTVLLRYIEKLENDVADQRPVTFNEARAFFSRVFAGASEMTGEQIQATIENCQYSDFVIPDGEPEE